MLLDNYHQAEQDQKHPLLYAIAPGHYSTEAYRITASLQNHRQRLRSGESDWTRHQALQPNAPKGRMAKD